MSNTQDRVTRDRITTFPIYRDGYPFTIREVHDGDLLGMVTLRGESGEVTTCASEVPRRLYRIICTWPNGSGGPITGSFTQPLEWTWTEAQEWIASAREANSALTFTIEVAR